MKARNLCMFSLYSSVGYDSYMYTWFHVYSCPQVPFIFLYSHCSCLPEIDNRRDTWVCVVSKHRGAPWTNSSKFGVPCSNCRWSMSWYICITYFWLSYYICFTYLICFCMFNNEVFRTQEILWWPNSTWESRSVFLCSKLMTRVHQTFLNSFAISTLHAWITIRY